MSPEAEQVGSDTAARATVPVLQRKAQAGRAEGEARVRTLPKALRLAIGRVADRDLNLALAVLALRREIVVSDDLPDLVEDAHLLLLLEGPGGKRGAAVVDPVLVGALIQQQTMGSVMPADGAAPRAMTATDAAIVAPLIDAILKAVPPLVDVIEDQPLMAGYAFGAHVPDVRLLHMALQAPEQVALHLTLDVAGGVRQGQVLLLVPPVSMVPDPVAEDEEEVPGPTRTLEPVVMELSAVLQVALTRITVPLDQLQGMAKGQCLDLGTPSFERIEVLTPQGQRMGQGQLGQLDGQRAVQLAHRKPGPDQPKRRAGDVPSAGLGVHQRETDERAEDAQDHPVRGAAAPSEMPALDDMPDMSDLPDLPDMSDLPLLAEED